MTDDEKYMARCLQLARHGAGSTAPNPMVGAVIVADGRIVGEGWHRRCGGPHAEVNAVRSVRPADRPLLPQSTIYVSLEPCSHWGRTPPCAELLAEVGFRRVVVGSLDPNAQVCGRGVERLRQAGAEVTVGVLEDECRRLNRRFMTFHQLHRPYITLKWAQSADGYLDRHRTAWTDGPAARLSSPWTQMLVHRLRAMHEAILVGHRTWLLDRPSLTTRHWPGRSPVPFVLSASGNVEGAPHVVRSLRELTGGALQAEGRALTSVLVEGGAATLQAFLDADLWDEAYVEHSPVRLGSGVKAPEIQTDLKGRPVHVNFT